MTKTEIKKWFTSFLHKNDVNNKLKCWFEIETPDTVGLSSLEIPHIDLLWLENGNVFYHIDHTEDSHLLEELDTHNALALIKELKTQSDRKHYEIEFENKKGEKLKYTLKEIKYLAWTNFHKIVDIVISSPDGYRRFIWPIDKIFINDKCLSKCSVVKYL